MDTGLMTGILKQSAQEWNQHKAPRLAAALAYYTVFSIAPLLVIAIAITGLIYRQVNADLPAQLGQMIPGGGQAIQEMIKGASQRSSGIIETVISIITLILGATGFFGALQDALNTIWEVAPKPDLGFRELLRQRFLSFTMVLGSCFLLLVSLIASTAVAALTNAFKQAIPGLDFFWPIANFLVSFSLTVLIFAMIYRFVPDVELQWGDVWIGAAVTAALFAVGQLVLGLYLGRTSTASTYGAIGSLLVLLLWVYYAAQILFFGAEFTRAYALTYGSHITPAPHAVALTPEARIKQGIVRPEELVAASQAAQERQAGGPTISQATQER